MLKSIDNYVLDIMPVLRPYLYEYTEPASIGGGLW